MSDSKKGQEVKSARVYPRVSTDEQDLARQDAIVAGARAAGCYVAAVYREKASGARLAVPGIVDLSELVSGRAGAARIVLEAVQEMLLRVTLRTARDNYEDRRERQRQGIEIANREGRYTGRKADQAQHRRIVALREAGMSIEKTTERTSCSPAVKRVKALYRTKARVRTRRSQPEHDGGSNGSSFSWTRV